MAPPRLLEDLIETPLPVILPAGEWKTFPIVECGEPLVPLGLFLDSDVPGFSTRIFEDMIYKGGQPTSPYEWDELAGVLITPFAREGVAKRLARAADSLPEGYALLIWDSYRTLKTQEALFVDYRKQLMQIHKMDFEEAEHEAQEYVKQASADMTKPSPHNTGGSIDLTIVKFLQDALPKLKALDEALLMATDGERYEIYLQRHQLMRDASTPLLMGVEFDEAVAHARTRFYEEKLVENGKLKPMEMEYLQNRRMMVNVMYGAGFSNYFEECWHFDYGNQFDAIRTGKNNAIYSTGPFSDACKAWEKMRLDQYRGTVRHLAFLQPPQSKLGDTLSDFVRRVALNTGDYRKMSPMHRKASRLLVMAGAMHAHG